MAKGKKIAEEVAGVDEFAKSIMEEINRSSGEKVFIGLDDNEMPEVKRWISTGSKQLDYRIANRRHGGIPEGKIIELFGAPSSGKTHIAYEIMKNAQKMGGIVFYIDTEQATSKEHLLEIGISPKNFIFTDKKRIMEEVFGYIESIIIASRNKSKDVPVVVVIDSIAALIPKSRLDSSYEDKIQIGSFAKPFGDCLTRIVEVVGQKNVTLLLCNQIRNKINISYGGDPEEAAGGWAPKFYSATRIKLTAFSKVYDSKKENVIGVKVRAHTEKNKVGPPKRTCEFEIQFGVGIVEHEYVFDKLKQACKSGPILTDKHKFLFEDKGNRKQITISDASTGAVIIDKKLMLSGLAEFFSEHESLVDEAMEKVYVYKGTKDSLEEELEPPTA